ncbi:hypothetical protein Q5752_007070 [Cryptotrichosporon argae]
MAPSPFGTASAYADAFPAPPPRHLTVDRETCFNLGVFKDLVRTYRKLDDHVVIRLNRAQAELRDRARAGGGRVGGAGAGDEDRQDAMCARMWAEVVAGWAHRQTLLMFCERTVRASLAAKKDEVRGIDERLAGSGRRGWKEEQVLADQLDNEASVEAIVRKRTLDAYFRASPDHGPPPSRRRAMRLLCCASSSFKSRCPFFAPPAGAPRGWWDLADSARKGTGPEMPDMP